MPETVIVERDKSVEKEKEALAKGPLFGGHVSATEASAGVTVLHEHYDEGYTPLVVKCTRGEQKAEVGDIAYQVTIPNEAEEKDDVYIVLIPGPIAEIIASSIPPETPMTASSFNDFQEKSAKRKAEERRNKPAQLPSLPSRPSTPTPPVARPKS